MPFLIALPALRILAELLAWMWRSGLPNIRSMQVAGLNNNRSAHTLDDITKPFSCLLFV